MGSIPIEGISSAVMSILKNLRTILSIKYERNTITRPTTAATIVFLAASTALLSPPDNIHLIPPQMRNASAITTAITKEEL